jgi:quercetin dioxygenase-like cupin family protein
VSSPGEVAAGNRPVYISRPQTSSHRQLRAGRGDIREVIGPAQGSRLDIHINQIRAGAGPGPYHLHSASENFYLVLEGAVRLRIAGTDHVVAPGDAALIAPGVPHSVSVVDDGGARLIEIYSPANPDFVLVKE